MAYLEIHTVDVGQGDCQFIAVKGSSAAEESSAAEGSEDDILKLIMIDAGGWNTRQNVIDYWTNNFNGKKIDTLIISHWDEDHYGGLNYQEMNWHNMFSSESVLYAPDTCSNGVREWFYKAFKLPGDYQPITIQDAKITFLCKDDALLATRREDNSKTNRSSIAVLIELLNDTVPQFKYYTAGDLSYDQEDKLIQSLGKLDCIKLSHHGANTATTNYFLAYTTPNLAICSNGNNSNFLHPRKETLDRLKYHHINTLLTNKKTTESYQSNQQYIAYAGNENLKSGNIKQIIKSNSKIVEVFLESSQLKNLVDVQYSNLREYNKIKVMLVEFANILKRTNYNEEVSLEKARKISSKLLQISESIPLRSNQERRAARKASRRPPNLPRRSKFIQQLNGFRSYLSIICNREPCKFQLIFPDNPLSRVIGTANLSEESSSISAILKEVGFGHLAGHFPSFVDDLFGEVKKSEEDDPDDNNYHIYSLNKKLEINDNLSLDDSEIHFTVYHPEEDNNSLSFFKGTFHSTLKIKEEIFYIHIDFSSNNTWELEIDPENLTLADIVEIIPGFNHSDVEKWTEALHLENLYIERAAIGVNFSSEQKIQYLSLGLGVEIFNDYLLQLTLTYRPGQGMSVYGSLSDLITTHELLKSCGVSDNHIKKFPDIQIDDFGFSATPKNKDYDIQAKISNISESFSIGEIDIKISSLSFEINKQETKTSIHVKIEGTLNDTDITIISDYDSTSGFVFTGTIEEIDTNSLLSQVHAKLPEEIKLPNFEDITIVSSPFSIDAKTNADFKRDIEGVTFDFKISAFAYTKADNYKITGEINLFDIDSIFTLQKGEIDIHISELNFSKVLKDVGVNESIASVFGLELNDVDLSIQKNQFSFDTEFKELLITKEFLLHDNTIEFAIAKGKGLNVNILTNLDINYDDNNKIKCSGGLNISPKAISFFAKSEGSIKNVFGIKDFNFGELFVSLNESETGLGVGFMGNLEFKKLSGQIALYFSTTNPADKLLAINLDSLTLFDIVDSIVECKNTGIDDILDSIGIKPIELNKSIDKPELNENIKTIIKETDNDASGNYILKSESDDGYNWLPSNSYLIEDKNNFRSYMLRNHISDSKYTLEKWVSLYGCASATYIELNGCKFEAGFAFSGELNLLGVSQVVNFKAKPKEGIQLYTELVDAIKLGSVLTLCRVEDEGKGPILSLSTYPNDRHFYLSAKLKILSIIDFETKILFADNKFAFMLNQNILGFRSSIKAAGDFSSLNETAFALSIVFETNGFTEITQEVSKVLHEAAEEVQKKTHKVSEKLAGARRTVNELNRNITSTQNDINGKNKRLKKLTHKHYPWYKSYKYAALGVEITIVGAEIAGLYTYMGAQITSLETAKEVLYLAQKAVEVAGDLAAEVIEGLEDVVSVIGKSIDWLIRINKVDAAFNLEQEHQRYDFALDFDLCGKNHTSNFHLEIDGNLKDTLLNKIKGLIHKTNELQASYAIDEENIVHGLNQVYGEINPEKLKSIKTLKDEYAQLSNIESYNTYSSQILNRTKNDIKIIQEALGINTKNCNYTCSISQENILSLKGQIANLVTEQKKQQEFFEKHNKNIEQALANTNDKLKEFSYVYFKSTNNSLHEEFIVKTKSISEKLDIQKKKNVESISSIDLDNCIKNSFDFVDTLGSTSIVTEKIEDETHFRTEPESIPQESKIEIIKKYEDLTNNDSVLSPYMKAIFFKNLGIAYAEIGDKTKSNKNLGNAINLYKDLLGQDSEEVKVVNELQAKLK